MKKMFEVFQVAPDMKCRRCPGGWIYEQASNYQSSSGAVRSNSMVFVPDVDGILAPEQFYDINDKRPE